MKPSIILKPRKHSKEWWEERILALLQGQNNDPFSKFLKVIQYIAVMVAEFNLMRFVLRALNGKKPTADVVKQWYNRFRALGSDISTMRMVQRWFIWFGPIKFYLTAIKKYREGGKYSCLN